ncbi:MAG: hypothetical protein ACK40V_06200, partial [Anaerolineales bacterium]
FTKEEMKHLIAYLDMQDFENEMKRMHSILDPLHIDVEAGKAKILEALPKADPKTKNARFHFEMLASPSRMIGENGILKQLEIEENILVHENGRTAAKGTGKK